MFRSLLLVISVYCLFIVPGFAQNKYKVVAIGFYNCENLFDTVDNPEKKDEDFTPNGPFHNNTTVYQNKLHNTATVFQKMGTDITPDGPAVIGVAEVENGDVLRHVALQPEIKARNYQVICFPTSDERGISTGMLYNPKYLTVLHAEPIKVPVESIGWSRPTRDVLHVHGVLAGDTVHFLVNHWPSKAGDEAGSAPGRRLAAEVNKRFIDSLLGKDANTKIFLLGDLNDGPRSEGVRKILKAKADVAETELKDVYNPWINVEKKGNGSHCYQGEWSMIDQIMLSGAVIKNNNNKWKYYSSEIFKPSFLLHRIGAEKGLPHRSYTVASVWDNGYSDHLPVLVYLIEKDAASPAPKP